MSITADTALLKAALDHLEDVDPWEDYDVDVDLPDTDDQLGPVIPDTAMDALTEARTLTLELADLEKQVLERHERRGELLVQVKTDHPQLTYGDLAAALGLHRSRAHALTKEAQRAAAAPPPTTASAPPIRRPAAVVATRPTVADSRPRFSQR